MCRQNLPHHGFRRHRLGAASMGNSQNHQRTNRIAENHLHGFLRQGVVIVTALLAAE